MSRRAPVPADTEAGDGFEAGELDLLAVVDAALSDTGFSIV